MATKTNSSKYWDIAMNFIGGCSPCADGCAHCWAADCASKRLANHPLYKGLTKNGKWTGEVRVMPELIKVIGGKPKTIFWCNMADMFHEKVSFTDIHKAFVAMDAMSQHKHLILTKRVKRMSDFIYQAFGRNYNPTNVHLGVSICMQKEEEKIPILLQIPAAVRFVSFEPLLEPIIVSRGLWSIPPHKIGKLDWGIVGCESGPKRRTCPNIRGIIGQFYAANIPLFVKQISINGKVCHNPDEWPEDLRVRQWPKP